MLNNKKGFFDFLPDDGIWRYVAFAAIPVVILILIIVIIRVDPSRNTESDDVAASTVAAQEAETTASAHRGDSADDEDEDIYANGETLSPEEEAMLESIEERYNNQDEFDEDEENSGENSEGDSEENPEGDTSGNEGDTEEPAETAPAIPYSEIDISEYTLKQDAIPELTHLIETYCQAKHDSDPELMAQVYGLELTQEELDDEYEKMQLVRASVKRYDNISCYSIEGPEADSYVVFPYFEIRYRDSDVAMPTLTWAYARKNSDGSYILVYELDEETEEYISRIGQKQEVRDLIEEISTLQAEAIAEDEALRNARDAAEQSDVEISLGE